MPVTLRALSARNGVRRVLAAYAVYCLIELTMWVGIILYAFAEGGPTLAGIVAVAQLVPSAVIAPVLTGVMERLPRGRALMLAYLAVMTTLAWTLLSLAAAAPLWLVVVAATTSVTAIAVARPLHFAVLPRIADTPDDLVSSLSLSSMAEGFSLFLGPILAGVATQALGTWSVVAGAVVAAGLVTVLVLRVDVDPPAGDPAAAQLEHEEHDEGSPLRAALAGFEALRGDAGAIALMVMLTVFFVFIGALDVLGVALSEQVFDLGHSGSGLLIGAAGIGAFVGAAVASSFVRRPALNPVVTTTGVVLGVAMAAVAVAAALPPAMAMIALAGMAGQLLMVAGRTLLQRSTDDSVLARVFAVAESTSLLGLALGSAIAPVLVSALGASSAYVPLGLGIALASLVCALYVRRLDARAVYRPAEIELLRSVPFLGVLPPYELERLAKNVTYREVPGGTVVVAEGEAGRDFFILDEGELSVSVHGVERTQHITAPGWFGEIALLQDIPRTATVTAITPARLLRVEAADFLAAVTGSADGRKLADEVTLRHLARDRSGS